MPRRDNDEYKGDPELLRGLHHLITKMLNF